MLTFGGQILFLTQKIDERIEIELNVFHKQKRNLVILMEIVEKKEYFYFHFSVIGIGIAVIV